MWRDPSSLWTESEGDRYLGLVQRRDPHPAFRQASPRGGRRHERMFAKMGSDAYPSRVPVIRDAEAAHSRGSDEVVSGLLDEETERMPGGIGEHV